uniref:SKA1 protein n=1 Tax=Echinostoma caproni TaxID=27848 RepID=A0A183APQ5_9TREM
LRELSVRDNVFCQEEESLSTLAKKVKEKIPKIVCLNSTFIDTLLNSDRISKTQNGITHQREIYKLIEDQLTHLTTLTAPLEESLHRSFSALQDVLSRLDLEESAEESQELATEDQLEKDPLELIEDCLTPKASPAAGDLI